MRSTLRSLRHWTSRLLVVALTCFFALVLILTVALAASGTWLTPVAPGPPTTTTTTTDPPVVRPALDASPAASLVATLVASLHHLLGYAAADPTYATTDPLLAGCDSATIPVAQITRSLTLSSTSLEVVADIDVYGAGLGGLVVANTLFSTFSCSGDYVQTTAPLGLNGFEASGADVSGSSILEVTFRRGDTVISLYAFPNNYQDASTATLALAAAIDAQFAPAMSAVCANENAPAAASSRNPTRPNYRPYATTILVTPPAQMARPDLSLLNGALPIVKPPPAGSITTAPKAPVVPAVALTARFTTPTPDTVGPGCGWSFTAMVPPTSTSSAGAITIRVASAVAQLKSDWAKWPTIVATYLMAKAVYLNDLASYKATIPTSTTSTTLRTTATTTTTSTTTTTTTTPPVTTSTLSAG
jgi:hypothetical protein